MIRPFYCWLGPLPISCAPLWPIIHSEGLFEGHVGVAGQLCRKGILVFPYLDDWLLKGCSLELTSQATSKATDLFRQLGLRLHIQKSILTLVQTLEFIGTHLSSITERAYLPWHRFVAHFYIANMVQLSPQTTVRNCIQLLGHIAATTFMTEHARLRMHCLQRWFRTIFSPTRHSLGMLLSILSS